MAEPIRKETVLPFRRIAVISLFALALVLSASAGSATAARENLLWVRDGALTSAARQLVAILHDVQQFGLGPNDYAGIVATLDSVPVTADSAANTDALLSRAAARLATELHGGRVDPHSAGYELSHRRAPLDADVATQILAQAADVRAALARFEPQFAQYRALERVLERYRHLPALPPLVPPGDKPLAPGDGYAGAPSLRRYLAKIEQVDFGTHTPASLETVYDDALAAAVRQFQRHHGLAPDGKLGPRTFAALSVPVARRQRQIELTLERLRWLPDIEAPAVIVNVPQYMLYTLPATTGAEVMRIPVIVGASARQTPVFDSRIESVVFRPYWDIPRSILVEELLPQIARDPGYIARHDMEIVGAGERVLATDADAIRALRSGRARLRQRPGDQNALGLIKFVLPNPYGVYLHSTPEARLFERDQRALSHGCVRVSDAVGLAAYLLAGTPGAWTRDKIEAATCLDVTQTVRLAVPVPVFVLYVTVVIEQDCSALFFDDVYGHDRELETLLEQRVPSPP